MPQKKKSKGSIEVHRQPPFMPQKSFHQRWLLSLIGMIFILVKILWSLGHNSGVHSTDSWNSAPLRPRVWNCGLPVIPALSLAEFLKRNKQIQVSDKLPFSCKVVNHLYFQRENTCFSMLSHWEKRLELKMESCTIGREGTGVTGVTHQHVPPRELRDMIVEILHSDRDAPLI